MLNANTGTSNLAALPLLLDLLKLSQISITEKACISAVQKETELFYLNYTIFDKCLSTIKPKNRYLLVITLLIRHILHRSRKGL